MEDHERVKLLESYGTSGGAYCSYAMGHCVHQPDSPPCRKRNPVACRNCRQRNEREATQ